MKKTQDVHAIVKEHSIFLSGYVQNNFSQKMWNSWLIYSD